MNEAIARPAAPRQGVRHRFEALDALRGICALMVCLFHFRASGPIADLELVRGSWLFVDFFFVLSGFVIAANYRERLTRGTGLRDFAVLRFGRVYPLHLVMLLLFIAVECVALLPAIKAQMHRQPFDAQHSVFAIFTNLTLTHAFGLHPKLTWNHPSWTIAVEFWTYLVFGLLAVKAGDRLERWLGVAMLICVIVLASVSDYFINVTHAWSFFRCLYGFAAGAILWRWWSRSGQQPGPYPGATFVELGTVALVVLFVAKAGALPVNLLAPFVFGLAVYVFARSGGAVSRLLHTGPLLLLGSLSYSIYMVHIFVQSRMDDSLRMAGKLTGSSFVTTTVKRNGHTIDLVGATPLQGTLFTLLMLAAVIGLSWLTWRWIELPGQRWARRHTRAAGDLPSASGSAKSPA